MQLDKTFVKFYPSNLTAKNIICTLKNDIKFNKTLFVVTLCGYVIYAKSTGIQINILKKSSYVQNKIQLKKIIIKKLKIPFTCKTRTIIAS